MVIKKVAGEVLYHTDLNSNSNAVLNMALEDHVRALKLAAQTYGKDMKDLWGEAYIDSDGRNNSVGGTTNATFDTDKYKPTTIPKIVEHAIPTGTFSATISSVIVKALIKDWEVGDTITHELKNGTETSGSFNDGEIKQFTAFTSEPTKLITTLTPKVTPTTGYPSIYGVAVYSE